MDFVLTWLDLAGVAVFAVSGALKASQKRMDIFGFLLVGTVTGIGGGTLRDLLLGIRPVFWITEVHYLAICAGAAALTWLIAHKLVGQRQQWLNWADAAGVAAFAVIGAQIALASGTGWAVAVLMGVMTATFGGIVRDVLCAEVPLILQREIYATAAALGAGVYVAALTLGLLPWLAALLAVAAGFSLRAVAILFGLSLPGFADR